LLLTGPSITTGGIVECACRGLCDRQCLARWRRLWGADLCELGVDARGVFVLSWAPVAWKVCGQGTGGSVVECGASAVVQLRDCISKEECGPASGLLAIGGGVSRFCVLLARAGGTGERCGCGATLAVACRVWNACSA